MSDVELWLHPDIFYYGIIYAHPKLTVPYLKKVVVYAKAKEGGFPNLSWAVWKHMAVNKMLMDENLAWTYFQVFHTLNNKSVKERLEFAELQQQLSESQNSTTYKQHMKVSTLEFVLFLFIQQANKVSLRKSLMGEEWPGTSPRLESPVHSSRSDVAATTVDEKKHNNFVLSHFPQIVDILSEGNKSKAILQDFTLSAEVVKALGYLVRGRISPQNTVYKLYDLATRHRIQGNSGYNRSADCFSMHKFEQWLNTALGENPFGLASCIASGLRLNWADLSPRKENQRRKGRVATNTLSAPNDSKLMVFSQCSNQTVARQTAMLNGTCSKIHRCHAAYIYLLSPLKCVSIEKCNDSCIVLGPVSMCVKISNCQNITLISPCQSVIVSSSKGVVLYITTPTQPVILGDNILSSSDPPVTLAPYNTFYANLENHLASIGLAVSPNTEQWNNPICVDNRSSLSLSHSRINDGLFTRPSKSFDSSNGSSSDHRCQFYRLMNLSDFYTFSIPFKILKGTSDKNGENGCITEEIPGGLPKEYAQAVKTKQRGTERWRQAVKKSNMTKDERALFQKLVEEKFKDWVMETNNQRQLDDLGQKKNVSTAPIPNTK